MFEDLREYILKNLQKKVIEKRLNDYQTFGKRVEEPVSDLVEEYFKSNNICYKAKRAKNKNEFPDLNIKINGTKYAFEHKAGASDNDSGNDLGTLNSLPEKIKKYGDNIYYIFVKYSKANGSNGIVIDDIYFDKIYRFVGKSSAGKKILKYRKKDGNLRPKVWNDFSNKVVYFDNLREFEEAISKTVEYRAERLVEQHMESLGNEALKRIIIKAKKLLN